MKRAASVTHIQFISDARGFNVEATLCSHQRQIQTDIPKHKSPDNRMFRLCPCTRSKYIHVATQLPIVSPKTLMYKLRGTLYFIFTDLSFYFMGPPRK